MVLNDPATALPLDNVQTYQGQTINGAFTVWVRWPLMYNGDGTVRDFDRGLDTNSQYDVLIVTSQGIAPRIQVGGGNVRSYATQTIEATVYASALTKGDQCPVRWGQKGGGPGGAGLSSCQAVQTPSQFVGVP